MSVIAYGSAIGEDHIILEAYNGLNTVFVENLPIAVGDTLHWIYCLDEWFDCFVLLASIDQSAALLADSILVSAQFLTNNAFPTQLVLHPSGPTTVVDDVTSSDCIWWSVEETMSAPKWMAYPNPTSDALYVRGNANQITLLDLQGREIRSVLKSSDNLVLHVHDLTPGIYVLRDEYGIEQRIVIE
jgi:hypothetical protein